MAQKPTIIPVILAGGEGKRLWPLSTAQKPKQFLVSDGKQSLFQRACLRAQAVDESLVVLTTEPFRFMVVQQLYDIGITQAIIVLEPQARNTAPAIVCAATMIQQKFPHAVMLVLPSDHHIGDEGAWLNAVHRAASVAQAGHHVTFGIQPDHPSTRYGYIGKGVPYPDDSGASHVGQFHEKPDVDTAACYIQSGYLWNSGMFLFHPQTVLNELTHIAPILVNAAREACEKATEDMNFWRLDAAAYQGCPDVAIDRVLMERTQKAVVVEGAFAWSDLGSYRSMEMHYTQENNVSVSGFSEETSNVIYSDKRPVYLVGVDHIRVVATDEVTVVMPRDMENVSGSVIQEFHQKHQRSNRGVDYRPWGYFQQIFSDAGVKIKRLTIRPSARISLQEHQKRSEHWVVVSGQAKITIGDDTRIVKADESVYVPRGCKHRIENTGDQALVIIEIQSGEELSEEDIIRFEDDYGRHQ